METNYDKNKLTKNCNLLLAFYLVGVLFIPIISKGQVYETIPTIDQMSKWLKPSGLGLFDNEAKALGFYFESTKRADGNDEYVYVRSVFTDDKKHIERLVLYKFDNRKYSYAIFSTTRVNLTKQYKAELNNLSYKSVPSMAIEKKDYESLCYSNRTNKLKITSERKEFESGVVGTVYEVKISSF